MKEREREGCSEFKEETRKTGGVLFSVARSPGRQGLRAVGPAGARRGGRPPRGPGGAGRRGRVVPRVRTGPGQQAWPRRTIAA
jgi:hypothetical protein